MLSPVWSRCMMMVPAENFAIQVTVWLFDYLSTCPLLDVLLSKSPCTGGGSVDPPPLQGRERSRPCTAPIGCSLLLSKSPCTGGGSVDPPPLCKVISLTSPKSWKCSKIENIKLFFLSNEKIQQKSSLRIEMKHGRGMMKPQVFPELASIQPTTWYGCEAWSWSCKSGWWWFMTLKPYIHTTIHNYVWHLGDHRFKQRTTRYGTCTVLYLYCTT